MCVCVWGATLWYMDRVITRTIERNVRNVAQLQQQESELRRAQLRDAAPSTYPDATLNAVLLFCAVLVFFFAQLFRVVSLAIIVVPSVLCSIVVMLVLAAFSPIRRDSVTRNLVLGVFVMPVALLNFLLALFPVVSIISLLKYRVESSDVRRSSVMEEIEYVTRYSTFGYCMILSLALCAAAFAALAYVLALAARPSLASSKSDMPVLRTDS